MGRFVFRLPDSDLLPGADLVFCVKISYNNLSIWLGCVFANQDVDVDFVAQYGDTHV